MPKAKRNLRNTKLPKTWHSYYVVKNLFNRTFPNHAIKQTKKRKPHYHILKNTHPTNWFGKGKTNFTSCSEWYESSLWCRGEQGLWLWSSCGCSKTDQSEAGMGFCSQTEHRRKCSTSSSSRTEISSRNRRRRLPLRYRRLRRVRRRMTLWSATQERPSSAAGWYRRAEPELRKPPNQAILPQRKRVWEAWEDLEKPCCVDHKPRWQRAAKSNNG